LGIHRITLFIIFIVNKTKIVMNNNRQVAKPLYFYRRFNNSYHNVAKRAYYYNRLMEMGIDAHRCKVMPTKDNDPVLVIVECKIGIGQWSINRFDYKTNSWEFICNRVTVPMEVSEHNHFNCS